jgi:hypothetical protein
MQILVLGPETNDFSPNNTHEAVRFARQNAEALVAAGHTVFILYRQATTKQCRLVQITPPGMQSTMLQDDFSCTSDLPPYDLLLAHHWTAVTLLHALAQSYHGHIFYFSHCNTFLPTNKTMPSEALAAEVSIVSRVTWCTTSREEQTIMQSILPNNRLLHLPVSKAMLLYQQQSNIELSTDWRTFVESLVKHAYKPLINYTGQFATVQTTLRSSNNDLIWFEHVRLPGSVHVILENAQNQYGFIEEVRLDKPKPITRVLSGAIEPNEEPERAAMRELKEELGLAADSLELLWKAETTGTVTDTRYYFIAKGCRKVAEPQPEPGERIQQVHYLTRKEVKQHLERGDFGRSHTAVALFKLLELLPSD